MKRLVSAWLVLALFLAGALWMPDPLSPGAPDEATRAAQEIEELVRQLGDNDFATREEATRRLMTREDAVPALRKALRSPDQEVARRAAKVLEALHHKEDKRVLARLQELGKNGEADQAAELLVRRQNWDDEGAAWQVMTVLAGKVVDLGQKEFGADRPIPPVQGLPVGDFRRWADDYHAEFLTKGRVAFDRNKGRMGGFVVRAADISLMDAIGGSLLVAAGSVRTPTPMDQSREIGPGVIIAGGSVDLDSISGCVIVTDGDVTARDGIDQSLIVARGDVRCPGFARNSRIVTSGSVHLAGEKNAHGMQVKEREATPLGFVRFFDPARAGVTVTEAEGGVRVTAVKEGKPFARAGLQSDDLIRTIDGTAVEGPESFRRLLRTALAEGGTMVFNVRRAGGTMEIRVGCPD
jgi:hypothetical protein